MFKLFIVKECKTEIKTLEVLSINTIQWDFKLDKNNDPQYNNMIIGDDEDGNKYLCPACGYLLFTDEEEATNFLKGI